MGDADEAVRASVRFAQIPEWILYHDGLDAVDVRVFGALHRHDGVQAIPSLARLGALVRKSEDTVRRSIQRLRAVGAVEVEERFVEGRQTSNRYTLNMSGPASVPGRGSTGDTPGGSTDARDGGSTDATLMRATGMRATGTTEEILSPTLVPASVPTVDDLFDAWYKTYPRKVGRPKALTAYKAAVKKGSKGEAHAVARIGEGTARWIQHWERTRTEITFIPHPSTFLSQMRFLDTPPPVAAVGRGQTQQVVDDDRSGQAGRIHL